MACLRNGEEAPDENRQRELADELRAQVSVGVYSYWVLKNMFYGGIHRIVFMVEFSCLFWL